MDKLSENLGKVDNTLNNVLSKNPNTNISEINPDYSNFVANTLLGTHDGFMPSGLLQWVLTIIFILLIIYLWRYVTGERDKYMKSPLKHD